MRVSDWESKMVEAIVNIRIKAIIVVFFFFSICIFFLLFSVSSLFKAFTIKKSAVSLLSDRLS